jgi:putative redox protein
MKHKVITDWVEKMQFDSNIGGHHIILDAAPEVGGEDKGPRPKELMLASLAGCTGMDVISILNKMKVNVENFSIDIEAEVTEEHPKHYTSMHIIYKFKGKDLDYDKLKKAVDLSQDKYCGVSAVYRKAMQLTYEIQIIK